MKHDMNAVLIEPDQRSEIVFALAHHRSGSYVALVCSQQQKQFFEDFLLNYHCRNIRFATFSEYLEEEESISTSVVLLDVPETF